MNIFLLITIILGVSAQDILKKIYNNRSNSKSVYFFTAASCVAAVLFFVLSGGDLHFHAGVLPYSLVFGLFYGLSIIGAVFAIGTGPLSLSALVASFSLMLPTLYGLVFLNDPVGSGFWIGLLLLGVSLIMVNYTKEKALVSPKWMFFVFLAFLGNGMCSTVQKMQQMAFGGAYKNEFMIVALVFVAVVMGFMSFFADKKTCREKIDSSWIICLLNGFVNGVVNLFVMILSAKIPVSVMFPLISAGGLVVTYIISIAFYKEKLTCVQQIGFALGTLSVIFLSI